MEDALSFLDGESPAEPAVTPTPEATPPADAQPRGSDGKFAPKDAASVAETPLAAPQEPSAITSAPQPEPPPALAPPNIPEGYVPVGALQEVRNELKALKQAQQGPPPQAPDPIDDPAGYEAFHAQERASINFGWSMRAAVKEHGQELATQAVEWAAQEANNDPAFAQLSFGHPDPVGLAIEKYQRHQAFQELTDPETLASFRAWKAGQTSAAPTPAAPAATPAPPQSPVPSPSLAAAPNAGGTPPGAAPVYKGAAFDQAIL